MLHSKDICIYCLSIYYCFNCCLFSGAYIKEEYMNNNCSDFFLNKYNNYYSIPQNEVE